MPAIPFNTLFDAFSAANEKAWAYDRTLSLGASEVFTCMRKSFFKKFGFEPDDGYAPDWGAAKRGDIIENHFAVPAVQAILPEGVTLIMAGEDQRTLKKGRLSATPDGLILDAPRDALIDFGVEDNITGEIVTEFKSFDPRSNISEAKAVHVGQVQVQMGLMHELTNYRPEYGLVIYFNASFLTDIRIFVVKRDPAVYATAVKRAKMVYATEEARDLMAEGKISGDCKLCEFTQECALSTGEQMPTKKKKIADPEIVERLRLLAGREKDLAQAAKEAAHEKKIVAEEIKEILRKADTKGIGEEDFSISLSFSKGKKTLDTLSMAADGIDLTPYQREGNGFERLTVKLKGKPEDDEED